MRVALVTHDFFPNVGGVAAHVLGLGMGLSKIGLQPIVFYLTWDTVAVREDYVEPYGLHQVVIPIERAKHRRLVSLYRAGNILSKLLQENSIDLIHFHDYPNSSLAVRVGAGRRPLIFTNHTSGYLEQCQEFWGRLRICLALPKCAAVIAPSVELMEKSVFVSVRDSRYVYIPNGIDVERFRPEISSDGLAQQLGIWASDKVVLCARRIEPKNGVIYFLQAAKIVLDSLPDTRFLVVGGGPPEWTKELFQFVQCHELSKSVTFVGTVPNIRMPAYYSISQISVVPSLVEATSITVLESMASGLPVIGTRVGGIPELVRDEKEGFLVPPASPEALASAILRLLRHDRLRRQLGVAGRARVVDHFDWVTIAKKTAEVYEMSVRRQTRANDAGRYCV